MTTSKKPNSKDAKLASFYRSHLLENVIPFWMDHGLDRQYGGMLTSLDQAGNIMDTDKSVWFQGRAGWTGLGARHLYIFRRERATP